MKSVAYTFFILIGFCQMDVYCQAKKFTVSAGANLWLHGSSPLFFPTRYDGKVGVFTAAPTEKFTKEKGSNSHKGNYAFAIGIKKDFGLRFRFNTEVGYGKTSMVTTYSGFKFTDHIDSIRGFVSPSGYSVNKVNQSNQYLMLRSRLLYETYLFGGRQRFGVGAFGYYVLQSGYALEMSHYTNSGTFYYETKDIKTSDGIYQIVPELVAQISLYKEGYKELFFTS